MNQIVKGIGAGIAEAAAAFKGRLPRVRDQVLFGIHGETTNLLGFKKLRLKKIGKTERLRWSFGSENSEQIERKVY